MRIGIDMQATLGPMTGIGVYAAGVWQALRAHCREHEFVPLQWGSSYRWPLPAELFREQMLVPLSAMGQHLDVVHATGFPGPAWGAAKTVMTVHDLSVLDRPELMPSPASRWYWSQWLAWAARRADVLITPSTFTADRVMSRLGVPSRSIVTLPYPPRTVFTRASRAEQIALCSYLNINTPFCLGVGAMEPRKDWEGVLAAFARVAQRAPHRLVLAGPVNVPASRERLQLCIRRLGLEQRVQCLGYVPLHWLPVLYSAAELLIFPETYAGYGLPVLEAMACGTPVITYDNTALPETAGDAALLLQSPWSADVLAEMMLQVLQNAELRAEMSRRGLAWARRLSWEEVADCLAVIYAVSPKRSARPARTGAAQPVPRHRPAGADNE